MPTVTVPSGWRSKRALASGGRSTYLHIRSSAARDRAALERMCRYVLRPPLARARFERHPDGTVTVGMKRVFADGTAALRFTPAELVERLVHVGRGHEAAQ